jgi:cation diffusion facilitator CzcD-associated flavoprotein CzcO
VYLYRELWILVFRHPAAMARVQRLALRHLARSVADPALRATLTPDYTMGCKCVLLSNDYYRAVAQPNVEVVTTPIREVQPHAIVTGDGVAHDVDAIIFGTGFHVTDVPLASKLIGKDGRTLREHWDEAGMSALHGATVAGFPNLFLLVGPNTGLGHNSIIFMIESQLKYVLGALRAMEETGAATLEPRPEVQDAYNADIQHQLRGTVWNAGGCSSWYLDERGRNTTLWPTFTFRFRQLVRRFSPADYVFGPASHEAGQDDEGLPSPTEVTPAKVPARSS